MAVPALELEEYAVAFGWEWAEEGGALGLDCSLAAAVRGGTSFGEDGEDGEADDESSERREILSGLDTEGKAAAIAAEAAAATALAAALEGRLDPLVRRDFVAPTPARSEDGGFEPFLAPRDEAARLM